MLMQEKFNLGSLYLQNKDSLPFKPKIIPHLKSKYMTIHTFFVQVKYTGYGIFTKYQQPCLNLP